MSKSLGEGTMTNHAIKYLRQNNIYFDNFFKISGRYWLSDNFMYNNFNNDKNDFVKQLSENKWKYFVPNVRLKKSAYVASDVNISRYSPEADIQFDEDFTVDDEANEIRLTQPLAVGTTLTIVKKTGTDWIINFKD